MVAYNGGLVAIKLGCSRGALPANVSLGPGPRLRDGILDSDPDTYLLKCDAGVQKPASPSSGVWVLGQDFVALRTERYPGH